MLARMAQKDFFAFFLALFVILSERSERAAQSILSFPENLLLKEISPHEKGFYERHHPCRWLGHPALSHQPGDQQAASAGLRQADDILPAVGVDDGRHSGDFDHFNTSRPAVVSPAAG